MHPSLPKISVYTMRKSKSLFMLFTLAAVYLLSLLSHFPRVHHPSAAFSAAASVYSLHSEQETEAIFAPNRPSILLLGRSPYVSGLNFTGHDLSDLHSSANEACELGRELFHQLSTSSPAAAAAAAEKESGSCPSWITLTGDEFTNEGRVMELPCGLTAGSHITVVARPSRAHVEQGPEEQPVMVSQFMMDLQGLRTDGEEPARILHFNPRLRGDWSGRPMIEQNTCYQTQWDSALRCEGRKSGADEETVDGKVRCEEWIHDDDNYTEESQTTWWLNRLIERTKVSFDRPYPFVEEKLFVLTLSVGLEGYHVNVDGRHVTSFPYRTGFVVEDATGFSLNGDLEVYSIFAASLPVSRYNYAPQRNLEMLTEWQTPPPPDETVELFIGILSAGNHFRQRMAMRKTWISTVRISLNMVARFFVALDARKEMNVELMKEAEFFGDIVIVPYMDSYDLVVLKTLAIVEYGIRTVSAKYIMKCDDDTFVRIDSVMKEVRKIPSDASLYIGNINYHHKPLRTGKWAVTYEEWPEEDYPHYANGPGYVLSADIAHFVLSEFENHKLKLFKMEDVSVGMWVEQFSRSRPVEYVHSIRFCQYGCIEDYLTAHYQSPRQMICMWEKLQQGEPQCCNYR